MTAADNVDELNANESYSQKGKKSKFYVVHILTHIHIHTVDRKK